MRTTDKALVVYVTIDGREHVFHTYPGEYRNLMMLIYDKVYIENFGECKGIGRCGTCHVHVLNRPDLLQRQGNENTTLGKMSGTADNSRLACHIVLHAALDGLKVELVNDEDPGLY
jgi:2Fe-2S ferredoxin